MGALIQSVETQMRADSGDNWQERVALAYIEEPPFGWEDPMGRPAGADVELTTVILRMLGMGNIEYRKTTFAELLPGEIRGEWGISVSGTYIGHSASGCCLPRYFLAAQSRSFVR